MTLTINDTRNNQKGILWDALESGHVYIDKNGWYVMMTCDGFSDTEHVVNLSTGELVEDTCYNSQYDEFVPVKCRLEIFG